MLGLILVGLASAYSIWSFACLEANVRKARALGLPVARLPVDANNVFWILFQPHFYSLLDRLPIRWLSYRWALGSPVSINIHVADPDAIQDIVTRRGDFQHPTAELKILELYGPCISTVKWPDWPRLRKPMATPFNETIMASVWAESRRQTFGMWASWTKFADAGIPSYQRDTRTLSLNVLAAVGFGKPYDFRVSTEPSVDEIGEYRDSLQTVLDNIILLLIVPFRVLQIVPGTWAKIVNAAAADPDAKGVKRGLSVDEIFGNLFVINFAGHDTTANTLAFVTLLLAAHPDVQAWVAAETEAVAEGKPVEEWDYKQMFPKHNRCRAVFYETLRLFLPVPALPSTTSDHPQQVTVGDRTYTVPVGVNFTANLRAMQTHPQYWSNEI
ncbi:unnamed protein product [Clonostachys byssicola]|uniref:Cytochrome P450 n=1 Tax=Clonostachys byssicola TaxID=160290 RepID=A0A9N9XW03_9HYPO|nr:unnamed protein product [Clonostachys byssicola]